MHHLRTRLDDALLAIEAVDGNPDPAVQRLAASAAALADELARVARDRVWN